MPYFKTAQEWLDQSNLLLQARPATVRPSFPPSAILRNRTANPGPDTHHNTLLHQASAYPQVENGRGERHRRCRRDDDRNQTTAGESRD